MSSLYGSEIELLAKALDFRTERNKVIAANLANADTPGFKAASLRFEKVLEEMLESGEEASPAVTDPRHFPVGTTTGRADPEVVTDTDTSRRDGNSVNVDREMVRLTRNELLYNANVETLSKLLAILEYGIEEGGR